ncbi:glycosyltransferase family 2 protein [Oceanomicrobium pacificus]|uniref:Glycosyltransferase n=1 Tax=Oceanomicrobium pacificus TaxID=2692916 RepID=A0A6B0TT71_9RHOB|nr:glycosyltransferase family 2 protein [Oceanomicrobium pacificus]MXU65969.1 glycosyltransferase [Oceanomicrobium pacificus]
MGNLFTDLDKAPPDRYDALAVPLGRLLMRSGALHREELELGLLLQRRQNAPLGDILVAENLAARVDVHAALARQAGLARVNPDHAPPDPALVDLLPLDAELALLCLPWRWIDGRILILIADPRRERDVRALCHAESVGPVTCLLAPAGAIRRSLLSQRGVELGARARDRCPDGFSCRDLERPVQRLRLSLALLALLLLLGLWPTVAASLAVWTVLVAAMGLTALRLVALAPASGRVAPDRRPVPLTGRRPKVSVLIPLRDEAAILPALLTALGRLTYPRALLDVKLLVEADDRSTRNALGAIVLPPWITVTIVPPDGLRTKPKAMNLALDFCDGQIIGILDAEDRPDPDQIDLAVRALAQAPPRVACVQARLDFYNRRANWLSRLFTIEYAAWFRCLLPALQRLGAPIPLGGTSVYFRRAALEQLGGWDAHNVTEDADLGLRLARFGYRCEMLDSTTWEEANARIRPWLRQRGRWIKGYIVTWRTHMRHPRAALRDLGPGRFVMANLLFLGSIIGFLAQPAHILLWLQVLGISHLPGLPGPVVLLTLGLLPWVVNFALQWRGTRRAGCAGLMVWVPCFTIYWTLAALAAYRALIGLLFHPFAWAKTPHGAGRDPLVTRPSG